MYLIILMLIVKSSASIFAKQAALTSVGLGLVGMVINIWLVFEFAALGLEAITWLFILRRYTLSFAYPFMSLVFGINLFTAWLIFDETIYLKHILGMMVIIIGVLVMTTSRKETNAVSD